MEEKQTIDFWLLITTLILAGIGLVIVYSSSMYLSIDRVGYGSFYFKKQTIHLLIGLVAMMLLTKMNYRGFANLGTVLLITGYLILGVLLIQKYIHGFSVHRWLHIGEITFQPSELMKVIIIIFLSSSIDRIGDRIREFKRGFLPLLGTIAVTFLLIVLEPDLGIAVFTVGIGFYILFIGRAKLLHLIFITFPVCSALILIVKSVPYMHRRLEVFFDPTKNYQINQSIISIGSGGFFGVGLGNSTQKFLFLPEHHTDFVFSILAEELGFIGTTVIMLLMLFYIARGFRIAKEAPDMFGFLLASGLSMMIGLQVFINIGVAVGILPTTGITLPFISYGGSSLLLSFIATGILLNISKQGSYERKLSRIFGSRLNKRSVWV